MNNLRFDSDPILDASMEALYSETASLTDAASMIKSLTERIDEENTQRIAQISERTYSGLSDGAYELLVVLSTSIPSDELIKDITALGGHKEKRLLDATSSTNQKKSLPNGKKKKL
eukprot:TRINITY_DN3760_c0_g1_i1.p1 TRINITY_DN3760_c0_g1~~TRINITY_DN3760_c0_g1_i1.p1  ORF type:complete len:116 (+),score=16.45 TRINITY_DN3760_c0_g1_i1:43-390(+)